MNTAKATIIPINLMPKLDDIAGDRFMIEQAASHLKNIWTQFNSAELYIRAGQEFVTLHGHLSNNSKHDKTRIGWVRAFAKTENKFGMDRRQAERLIEVSDAFFQCGNMLPYWKLPQSFRPLHALAKLKLDADKLKQCATDGLIRSDSTEADIRQLAQRLGLATPKQTKSKNKKTQPMPVIPSKSAPKKTRIAAAFEVLAALGLTVDDLEGEFAS